MCLWTVAGTSTRTDEELTRVAGRLGVLEPVEEGFLVR